MSKYLLILLLPCLVTCKKVDLDLIDNLHNGEIVVIGHRGAGILSIENSYPGNSLESMEVAIYELGAGGLEMDVQLSSDGHPMLYHDDDLGVKTHCTGPVYLSTRVDLTSCIYMNPFFNNTQFEFKLAALETVLEKFKDYPDAFSYYLDTKQFYASDSIVQGLYSEFAQILFGLISRYDLQSRMLIHSPNTDFLTDLGSMDPTLKLVIHGNDVEESISRAQLIGAYGIEANYGEITQDQVAKAHADGINVILCGVSSRSSCREAIGLSPDYIITENIAYLTSLLKP